MYVILQRDRIRSVLKRHREHYPDKSFRFAWGETMGEVTAKLEKLDLETCSADEVVSILNDSWVEPCDECSKIPDVLVHIGDEPDYESQYQRLCLDCLKRAVDLAEGRTHADNEVD